MQPTSEVKSRPTYPEFRQAFLDLARKSNLALRQVNYGNQLATDYAIVDNGSDKTFVHITGTHGVEGYFGSLLQQQILARQEFSRAKCNVVFVHALNAYGMHHYRRTNAANVDLNRNSVDHSRSKPPNSDYQKLQFVMQPKSLVDFWLKLPWGLLKTLFLLQQPRGLQVASGQFESEKGLFFGGKNIQPEIKGLCETLKTALPNTKQWIFVEVHTGLGPFAKESLILDGAQSADQTKTLGDLYQSSLIDPGRTPGFYPANGMLVESLRRELGQSILHITQEFGTKNFIQVLYALAIENAFFQRGPHQTSSKVADLMLATFYPASESWRNQCLAAGHLRFKQALAHFD